MDTEEFKIYCKKTFTTIMHKTWTFGKYLLALTILFIIIDIMTQCSFPPSDKMSKEYLFSKEYKGIEPVNDSTVIFTSPAICEVARIKNDSALFLNKIGTTNAYKMTSYTGRNTLLLVFEAKDHNFSLMFHKKDD